MAMRKIRYEAVNQLVVEDKTLMGGTIPGLESSVTPQFNAYRFAVTKSHLLPDFGFTICILRIKSILGSIVPKENSKNFHHKSLFCDCTAEHFCQNTKVQAGGKSILSLASQTGV